MTPTPNTGAEALDRLAGRDLNNDGRIVNLIICGNSKFYDYAWLENAIEDWVKYNGYPDLIILGGASGVDYLAERWADNNTSLSRCLPKRGPLPGQTHPQTVVGQRRKLTSSIECSNERHTCLLSPGLIQCGQNAWKRRLILLVYQLSASNCRHDSGTVG